MYKIISFSSESFSEKEGALNGWIETDEEYKSFQITEDNQIRYKNIFSKKKFRNYEHFVGVQSKFNPYQFFLADPVSLSDFTYESILKKKLLFTGL